MITLVKFLSYLRHAEKLIQGLGTGTQTSKGTNVCEGVENSTGEVLNRFRRFTAMSKK